MKRREFVAGIAGAVVCPTFGGGQQLNVPVIGFIRSSTKAGSDHLVEAFRNGLSDSGYVVGKNLKIEYRWANDRSEELPALAADLVGRNVAVIVSNHGSMAAVTGLAKAIPIVFSSGDD